MSEITWEENKLIIAHSFGDPGPWSSGSKALETKVAHHSQKIEGHRSSHSAFRGHTLPNVPPPPIAPPCGPNTYHAVLWEQLKSKPQHTLLEKQSPCASVLSILWNALLHGMRHQRGHQAVPTGTSSPLPVNHGLGIQTQPAPSLFPEPRTGLPLPQFYSVGSTTPLVDLRNVQEAVNHRGVGALHGRDRVVTGYCPEVSSLHHCPTAKKSQGSQNFLFE